MANGADSRRFLPDPPPAGADEELVEWIMRQFERLGAGTLQIAETQEVGGAGLQAHIDDTANPHSTTHAKLPDNGTNDHAAIDAHLADVANPHQRLVPWETDPTYGDLYPNLSGDAGIGTIDQAVAHVALGTQELGGMEGFIADRPNTTEGGVVVMGLREVDPQNPPAPPLRANAPVEIAGSVILLMEGTVYLQTPQAITDDHYLIVQPSVALPDGRIVVPITLGPEVVYVHEESASDATDYDVLDIGEVQIVSLTLVNAYAANVSTFSFQVYLQNLGRLTLFDVILKVDGVEQVRYPRELSQNATLVVDSFSIQVPLSPGQVISLDVEATSTHPQSEGWVRGTIQATQIRIKQG